MSKSTNKDLELNQHNLPKWDLSLLDLRLDEEEDLGDKSNKLAGEYSGAKLLDKIKTKNGEQSPILKSLPWKKGSLLKMK